jgi:hypothetical protein
MRTKNTKLATFRLKHAWMVASAVVPLLVVGYARLSFAQSSAPQTFSSAGEACHALFRAVQNHDEQALEAILGAGKELTSSSDEVEDGLEREQFRQKYQEMHRLVQEPDGNTVLYIGAENWPFPIPLVSKDGRWYFDPEAGMREILFRRIGANEVTAIQVCHAFATAKQQRAVQATGDDPIGQYAESLVIAGTANADNNTYAALDKDKDPYPFHEYYFRIVTEQPAATGTSTQISRGKKRGGGLALVAFPVEYRSSGVMAFIVTQDGVVYEKDLGPNTARLVPVVKEHSPDSTWRTVK